MAEDSNEFFWETFFVKVEDKLFCVPQCEFVRSSDVFADMLLLPPGPATRCEGQDRDLPIVLEGYKKDDFACLLKVMYPTATSLISGGNLELHLKKEEWMSVLKLSTIWNMTKIRRYAIHKLSTDEMLSPIEKFLLARAHGVGAWLDEAVKGLVVCNSMPPFEDLSTLGWETVARILWIRDNFPLNTVPGNFKRDAIKCMHCSSSSSLINYSYGCGHIASGDAELTYPGSGSLIPGTIDRLVSFKQIQCLVCRGNPFFSIVVNCNSCSYTYHYSHNPMVRVTLDKMKTMIEEMFGEEIKNYESDQSLLDSLAV